MTEQTKQLLTAAKFDGSMTDAEKAAIDALLDGRGNAAEAEELLPVAEVARRLHRTKKTIHVWCAQGYLHKVTVGGNSRASGIPAAEVARLMKGGAA